MGLAINAKRDIGHIGKNANFIAELGYVGGIDGDKLSILGHHRTLFETDASNLFISGGAEIHLKNLTLGGTLALAKTWSDTTVTKSCKSHRWISNYGDNDLDFAGTAFADYRFWGNVSLQAETLVIKGQKPTWMVGAAYSF
jgi:hypothetical protein